jgi:hypothetical protein
MLWLPDGADMLAILSQITALYRHPQQRLFGALGMLSTFVRTSSAFASQSAVAVPFTHRHKIS